jgi:hypothetical protein
VLNISWFRQWWAACPADFTIDKGRRSQRAPGMLPVVGNLDHCLNATGNLTNQARTAVCRGAWHVFLGAVGRLAVPAAVGRGGRDDKLLLACPCPAAALGDVPP